MVLGVGCDILEVSRMERELAREGGGFRDDVFTPTEIAYCGRRQRPARHFAARFAAKEALIKALGGVPESGVHWHEIEIETEPLSIPRLVLAGGMKKFAAGRGIERIQVSLSHTDDLAMAVVITES